MWFRSILSLFFIVLLLVLQITFIGNGGWLFKGINLVLIVLALLINIAAFNQTLFFLIVSGLALDIYSSLPFGVFLIILFFTAVILRMLFLNFFTNRSFYSLIFLGLIGVVIYHLFFLFIVGLLYLVNISDFFIQQDYWLIFSCQTISTFFILTFCFWLINALSHYFKPIFLRP